MVGWNCINTINKVMWPYTMCHWQGAQNEQMPIEGKCKNYEVIDLYIATFYFTVFLLFFRKRKTHESISIHILDFIVCNMSSPSWTIANQWWSFPFLIRPKRQRQQQHVHIMHTTNILYCRMFSSLSWRHVLPFGFILHSKQFEYHFA